jgi:hypothetical protein
MRKYTIEFYELAELKGKYNKIMAAKEIYNEEIRQAVIKHNIVYEDRPGNGIAICLDSVTFDGPFFKDWSRIERDFEDKINSICEG